MARRPYRTASMQARIDRAIDGFLDYMARRRAKTRRARAQRRTTAPSYHQMPEEQYVNRAS